MKLFNTATKRKEAFVPINSEEVKIYTCGPTVYHFAHIGNLRTYIFEDILKRTLISCGYRVKHVMNITDVGHLQSDDDSGDDKISLAAKKESKSPWEISSFYQKHFFIDCQKLNIQEPSIICKATDHIKEMINMAERLLQVGIAYNVDGNIYFDTQKYFQHKNITRSILPKKSRVGIDPKKKDQRDFVLWFSSSKFPNQIMKWPSPWGKGFPGWHIECSAMSMKYLGDKMDIHCGGIDHISVHHANEKLQSEAITGEKWVNYWMHGGFLTVDSAKMSKSTGNIFTLSDLLSRGFHPLHFRFFCLQSNYRKTLNFSLDKLSQAKGKYESLRLEVIKLKEQAIRDESKSLPCLIQNSIILSHYEKKFYGALRDDLDTRKSMIVFNNVIKDKNLFAAQKLSLLLKFDLVLGLGVEKIKKPELSNVDSRILEARTFMRSNRDYETSDLVRSYFSKKNIYLEELKGETVYDYRNMNPKDCLFQSKFSRERSVGQLAKLALSSINNIDNYELSTIISNVRPFL